MKHTHHLNLAGIKPFTSYLAAQLQGGEILALIGKLGSGKTTFTQTLGKALAMRKRITSPTFVVMQYFQGRLPQTKKPIHLFHLDLYRTKNFKEVQALGVEEFWQNPDTITVIEWANKIKKYLPRNTVYLYFDS